MKKTIQLILVMILASIFSGCASATFKQKLDEFESLGITSAEITGKFSHTKFTRREEGGKVFITLDHSNAWVPNVHIERELPVAK